MKLAIIGTGYVGLITGACFAEFGNQTVCIDKDEKRVNEFLELSMDNEYRFDSNLYESNIHPILRFIHEKDLETCGWVTVKIPKKHLQ